MIMLNNNLRIFIAAAELESLTEALKFGSKSGSSPVKTRV